MSFEELGEGHEYKMGCIIIRGSKHDRALNEIYHQGGVPLRDLEFETGCDLLGEGYRYQIGRL